MDKEVLGPEFNGRVELILSDSAPLEENHIKGIGESVFDHTIVKPDDSGIDLGFVFEPLDHTGLAQGDVDLASRCPPAWSRGFPAEFLVGIIDPAVVLFSVFIFRCVGKGIPLLPEGLHEHLPFPVGLKLEEDIFFFGSNDVDNLFFQPNPVSLGKVLWRHFLTVPEQGKQKNQGQQEKTSLSVQSLSFPPL